MTRPPKAREAILAAAERIVQRNGAAHLTFEELANESGVTRGGITYHFPTKDALLQGLVERDVREWSRRLLAHREALGDVPGADVIAQLRCSTEEDPARRRLIGGMLSAVAHDPALLQPVRDFTSSQTPRDAPLEQRELHLWLLRMAIEGLFWTDLMQCSELPSGLRERLTALIERLAREWSQRPPDTPGGSTTAD